MRNDASFLDTSGWMALLNTDDRLHASAVAAWREIARRRGVVVLTDWRNTSPSEAALSFAIGAAATAGLALAALLLADRAERRSAARGLTKG